MKKTLINFIHVSFKRLSYIKNELFPPTHPEIDLYVKKERDNKFENLIQKTIKIFLFLLLGFLLYEILITLGKKDLDKLTEFKIDNNLFWGCFWIFYSLIFIKIFYSLIRYNYRISLNEVCYILGTLLFYLNLRYDQRNLIQEGNTFQIFDLFSIQLIVYLFGSITNYGWPKYSNANNFYLEDNPVKDNTQTEVERKLIKKIKYSLFKDKYENSFSIGIVGPWGIGKSSFMNHLKIEIENQIENFPNIEDEFLTKTPQNNIIGCQEIVFFEFSPFLNHNEDTVINDFFTQLSNILSNRSGKLSNSLQTYSEKLISIADNNKLTQIFQLSNLQNENSSVNELYKQVNVILKELELKIIIFIDDLDRLSPKEILQVLKLIRNTSNFPNFLFVVALDKEYVVNALKEIGEYTNTNYIDKFFQLECYLPELDYTDLIESAILFIEQSNFNEIDKEKIKKSIRNEIFLFPEYIQNFRDVKKFINQLRFEYNNVQDLFQEIWVKDYINLMFLKNRFPEVYRYIIVNFESFFEISNDILNLKVNNAEVNQENMTIRILDELKMSQNQRYIRPNLSEYVFDKLSDCDDSKKLYSCGENDLIKRTIYEIFHKYEHIPPNSVKRRSNLMKIGFWRVSKDDLTAKDFEDIFNYYQTLSIEENLQISNELKTIIEDNKIGQLVTRISFENTEKEKQACAVIILIFDIIKAIGTDNKYFDNLMSVLGRFYNVKQSIGTKVVNIKEDKLKKIFKVHYIDSKNINVINKIDFINDLIRNSYYTGGWYYTTIELIDFQIEMIKQTTEQYNNELWLPNDNTILRCFYLIYDENMDSGQKIKLFEIVKEFLKNKKVNVLFFNLLNPEPFSHLAYRLNEIVNIIFNGTSNFRDFILEHYADQISSFDEILKFLKINCIVGNSRDLKFIFSPNILVGNFNGWGKANEFNVRETENSIQLFFEEELSSKDYLIDLNIKHQRFPYVFEGKVYWLFIANKKDVSIKDFISSIIDLFQKNIKQFHNIDSKVQINESSNEACLIDSNGTPLFTLISEQ